MSVARSLARVIRTAVRVKGRNHSHNVIKYARDFSRFRKALGQSQEWPFGNSWPIINEWHQAGGLATGAYFHQDLWAARKIFERNPSRHIDVGSRIDGFVAHVSLIDENGFDVVEFSFVDDAGDLIENAPLTEETIASNCSVNLGCALFDLHRRS